MGGNNTDFWARVLAALALKYVVAPVAVVAAAVLLLWCAV